MSITSHQHKIVAHKHSHEGSPTSNHRSSPGGVFSLDEDLAKSRKDARPTDDDVGDATSKDWVSALSLPIPSD
ncbi:hypothetical protein EIP86_006362 [Pleurotus ostreatoroseus]|nr:hypothetical protein EIP86_006362 [Pleurotus ostreatoroseus]